MIDRALLGRMPNIRVLARTGVGVDLVDVDAATERGIAVVITPGSGTSAVAEAVIGMALHLAKRFGPLTDLARSGGSAQRNQVAVGDLEGPTIGIVGYGRIGQRVGQLARGFGMRVLAYDPVTIPPDDVRCTRLSEIAARSDVITLHAPLTEATRHLVNRRFLSAVKPGALLINCGRGALIDADAVLDALLGGQLSGVGLDVFVPEPPAHHPLFDHPDVVLTPHLMGLSRRVDCLVNSAGLTSRGSLLDTSPELFDQHIAVNLRGPFFLMQAVVTDMLARQSAGTIVNIISTSEHCGSGVVTGSVIDWDQNVIGAVD